MDIKLRFAIYLIFGLFFVFHLNSVAAADINVGPAGYDYTTIQGAVDVAGPGDNIIVNDNNGNPYTYTENVVIDKENLTLKTQGDVKIKFNNHLEPVFNIGSSGTGTTIKDFHITVPSTPHIQPAAAIVLGGANCVISGNTINGYYTGISDQSTYNTIIDNFIEYNEYGIRCDGQNGYIVHNTIKNNEEAIYIPLGSYYTIIGNTISDNNNALNIQGGGRNTVIKNTFNGNEGGISINADNNIIKENTIMGLYDGLTGNGCGIRITAGDHHQISNNIIKNVLNGIVIESFGYDSKYNTISFNYIENCYNGIELIEENTKDNSISSNVISGCIFGIRMDLGSNNNILEDNTINYCQDGIYIPWSYQNMIKNNELSNNQAGINVQHNENTITGNKISQNTVIGLLIDGYDNRIHNNYFLYNAIQTSVTPTVTGNIFHMLPPVGGNFWSDYTGIDVNGDGFGDTPYTFENGVDYYPYLKPEADVKGGLYNTNQIVSLSGTGTIYYTTDGSNPTTDSSQYSGPITISSTKTLKFIAASVLGNTSPVYSEHYVIDKVKPTVAVNIPGGLYNTTKIIALTINEPGTIYYTLNGTNPTTSSDEYTSPISIAYSKTLKYFAVDQAGNASSIYTQVYTIDKTPPIVTSTYPRNYRTGQSRTATIYLKFSEKIKSSINWSKIYVKNLKTGRIVSISKWISGNTLYIKTKSRRLAYNWYQVYIPYKAVKDYAGNYLAKSFSFRFRTGRY